MHTGLLMATGDAPMSPLGYATANGAAYKKVMFISQFAKWHHCKGKDAYT